MRTLGWLALLASACAHRVKRGEVDPTLPEASEVVAEGAPAEILARETAQTDPTLRGRALEHLLATCPEAALAAWVEVAAADRDAFVTTRAAEALAGRGPSAARSAALTRWVEDANLNPVGRFLAAQALGPDPARAARLAEAARRARPWDQLPLWLAAAAAGDPAAPDALARVVSSADLPLDPPLILAAARQQGAGLADAWTAAVERAEPELGPTLAAARALANDPRGQADLRAALTGSDPFAAWEALDLLTDLPAELALPLAQKARTDPERALLADLVALGHGANEIQALDAAAVSPDREVRVELAAAIGRALQLPSLPPRVARRLPEALTLLTQDPEPLVQAAAYRAAAEAQHPLCTDPQLADPVALRSDSPLLRVEAAGCRARSQGLP